MNTNKKITLPHPNNSTLTFKKNSILKNQHNKKYQSPRSGKISHKLYTFFKHFTIFCLYKNIPVFLTFDKTVIIDVFITSIYNSDILTHW